MKDPGSIFSKYSQFYDVNLKGRYITLDHLKESLNLIEKSIPISIIGQSENGVDIPMIQLGSGSKKVLAWSQMHGNESTTTKAVMDFISFCNQKQFFQNVISDFLETYSFYIIPILNPDGALLYTRENINGIDLNRDAQLKSQKESRALDKAFNSVQPDLCLNLHDQRTIYGAAAGLPATVSFLSPSADAERTITHSRQISMGHIERMASSLANYVPGQVGRYDDSFNANCVGDTFQMKEVPTILFEAGQYPNDYEREQTRKLVFLALLTLFELEQNGLEVAKTPPYHSIPENNKNFRDVILRNFTCHESGNRFDMALQYEEILCDKRIQFQPVIDEIGDLSTYSGHLEVDVQSASLLVNSQKNWLIGQNVLKISDRNDPSIVYFSMK